MKLIERSRPHLLYDILDLSGDMSGGGAWQDPTASLPPFYPRDLPPLVGLPPAGTVSIGDLANQGVPNVGAPSTPSIYTGQTTGAGPMGPGGPTMGGGGGGDIGGRTLPPLQTPIPPPPNVSGLPPFSRPSAGSLPSLTSGVGVAPTTPLGFLSTLAQNLGKFAGSQAQQRQQRGGGGGGYEPVHGGAGALLSPVAVPQYASGLPTPQPLQLPVMGRFDNGGTAQSTGLYQVDAGETVRTPDQEMNLQQLLAMAGGGQDQGMVRRPAQGTIYDPGMSSQAVQNQPGARSMLDPSVLGQQGGLGGRAAGPGQLLSDTSVQQAGPPPGGVAFPGQAGQLMQGITPPQFGDPGAFPRIPGIPETGFDPQRAAGPGVPTQGPFQQAPMPGAFLDKGARTAWTIRDALNNVSQAAGRFQQQQWDKRMNGAQMQAMNEIQKEMKAQQRQPGQIPGQPAQQQPDEVTQAIQAAMQQTQDPKEREKLQKMLQQRAKAQQRESEQWAKTLMKAQDPTTPEHIGIQKAYATMRGMGQQAMAQDVLQAEMRARYLNSVAQYTTALSKIQQAQGKQQMMQQSAPDMAYLQGTSTDTSKLSPALAALIKDNPVSNLEKARILGGMQATAEDGRAQHTWDAYKETYAERDKNLKVSATTSETIMDMDSATGWSILEKNAEGHDIIDPKTGQPLIRPNAKPPAGIEIAQIHHMRWQDSDGNVHVQAITDYRNVPVNERVRFAQLYGNYPQLMNGLPAPRGAGIAPGGRAPQAGEPGFGSRGGQSGVTPGRTYPPGGSARTGTVQTGGDQILGQGKIPDMAQATMPGGRVIFGTPAQLRLVGVPAQDIMHLDTKGKDIATSARQLTSKGSLFDMVQDDLNAFKPEELTPLISRWDEWLAGTWGADAPEKYIRLRTHLKKLLGTAVMQSHISGGGEAMKNDFESITNVGVMDKKTIQAAFSAERDYIEDRTGDPRIRVRAPGQPLRRVPLTQLGKYMSEYKGAKIDEGY